MGTNCPCEAFRSQRPINDMVVQVAVELGLEDGQKLRVDNTVVQTEFIDAIPGTFSSMPRPSRKRIPSSASRVAEGQNFARRFPCTSPHCPRSSPGQTDYGRQSTIGLPLLSGCHSRICDSFRARDEQF
jgi:hypothetical protein